MNDTNNTFGDEDYMKAAAREIDRIASKDGIAKVEPEIAEFMGISEDNALSAEDAIESLFDLDIDIQEGENND